MPFSTISSPSPTARLNDALLKSFSAAWRSEGLAESTLKNYVIHLRSLAEVTGKGFHDIERADLDARVTSIIEASSASYAHVHARAFRRFFAWLLDEDEVEVNPAARLKLPKVPEPVTQVASAEEIQALIRTTVAKVPTFRQYRDRALLHVLRSTGLRISEAARITFDDIDLTSGVITIPKSKTRKPRYVMLDPQALRSMSAYLRRVPEGLVGAVWRSDCGKAMSRDGVKQIMDRRAKQAGLKVTPHQLRRGFAVQWLKDGGSQASLQQLCGWNSPAMVARYVKGVASDLALDEFRRLRG